MYYHMMPVKCKTAYNLYTIFSLFKPFEDFYPKNCSKKVIFGLKVYNLKSPKIKKIQNYKLKCQKQAFYIFRQFLA